MTICQLCQKSEVTHNQTICKGCEADIRKLRKYACS